MKTNTARIVIAIVGAAVYGFAMGLFACAVWHVYNIPHEVMQLEQEVDALHEQMQDEQEAAMYIAEASVTNVERNGDADVIACEDTRGHRWAFTGRGYNEGERIALMMHNAGTPDNVTDDTIKDAKHLRALEHV